MGKYNIPKQDSKQLIKEIRNSSEGGGVKEYYYTWNTDQYDIQAEFIVNVLPMIKINNVIEASNYAIYRIDKFFRNGKPDDICNRRFKAFCISSEPYIIYSGDNIDYEIYNVPEGDLITKLYFLHGGDYTIEQFTSEMNQYFKEITKEEYESMITYKPE